MPSPTLEHAETLMYKNSLERRSTLMWKSVFSMERDKEAMGHMEDADKDSHKEGTSHPRKGNIVSA